MKKMTTTLLFGALCISSFAKSEKPKDPAASIYLQKQSNHMQKMLGKLRQAEGLLDQNKIVLNNKEQEIFKLQSMNDQLVAEMNLSNIEVQKKELEITKLSQKFEEIKNNYVALSTGTKTQSRMPASVKQKSFHLTINSDFFASDGITIRPSKKKELKEMISKYINENYISSTASTISIVGHSSPLYKGHFIATEEASGVQIEKEMENSFKRAHAISKFILGTNFKSTDFNNDLKSKLRVSGNSFLSPIRQTRAPASVDSCETIDCKGSQRVEIHFN